MGDVSSDRQSGDWVQICVCDSSVQELVRAGTACGAVEPLELAAGAGQRSAESADVRPAARPAGGAACWRARAAAAAIPDAGEVPCGHEGT